MEKWTLRVSEPSTALDPVVSAAGKRCIPSTQFWLTVDACAAYRFPHSAGLHVQVRLGNMGFTTVLEEFRISPPRTDSPADAAWRLGLAELSSPLQTAVVDRGLHSQPRSMNAIAMLRQQCFEIPPPPAFIDLSLHRA